MNGQTAALPFYLLCITGLMHEYDAGIVVNDDLIDSSDWFQNQLQDQVGLSATIRR